MTPVCPFSGLDDDDDEECCWWFCGEFLTPQVKFISIILDEMGWKDKLQRGSRWCLILERIVNIIRLTGFQFCWHFVTSYFSIIQSFWQIFLEEAMLHVKKWLLIKVKNPYPQSKSNPNMFFFSRNHWLALAWPSTSRLCWTRRTGLKMCWNMLLRTCVLWGCMSDDPSILMWVKTGWWSDSRLFTELNVNSNFNHVGLENSPSFS